MKKLFFACLISCLALPISVLADQQDKVNHEPGIENKGSRCRRYKKDQQDINQNVSNVSGNEEAESCNKQNKKKGQLEIGYSAKAILGTGVSWSNENFNSAENEKKYMLRLDKGWTDSFGEDIPSEMLPEELRAIAIVTQRSNSGIFTMQVTEIIRGNIKIPIPFGAIQISAKDGSPLQAELKQKKDSGLARDFESVISAGVQETTNRSTIPGVARGTNDIFNRRRISRNNSSSLGLSSSYFQLNPGQEVLLTVYDNFEL